MNPEYVTYPSIVFHSIYLAEQVDAGDAIQSLMPGNSPIILNGLKRT